MLRCRLGQPKALHRSRQQAYHALSSQHEWVVWDGGRGVGGGGWGTLHIIVSLADGCYGLVQVSELVPPLQKTHSLPKYLGCLSLSDP